jgi:hypothetical protein
LPKGKEAFGGMNNFQSGFVRQKLTVLNPEIICNAALNGIGRNTTAPFQNGNMKDGNEMFVF